VVPERSYLRDNDALHMLKKRGLHARFVNNTIVSALLEPNISIMQSFTRTPTGEIFDKYQTSRYIDTEMNPNFAPKFIEALLQGPMTQEISSDDVSMMVDLDNNVLMFIHGTSNLVTGSLARRGIFNPSSAKDFIILKVGVLNQGERLKQKPSGLQIQDTIEISPFVDPSPFLPVVSAGLKELHSTNKIEGVHFEDDEDVL
jgi:hypothetical protein